MSHWIRSNAVGLLALFVALSGSAIAASLAKNSVTSKSIKNGAVASKDVKNDNLTGIDIDESSLAGVPIADGAITSAQIADGSVTRADTTERWALIDGDKTIIAQSGGISVTAVGSPGYYYVDFGSSQAGRSITVTTAFRDGDLGFGISAVAALCGGPPEGGTCPVVADDVNHVFVRTTADSGVSADAQAFYIRTN
jgi:hypothetical protein